MAQSPCECAGMMEIYATFKTEYISYRDELYNSFMGAPWAHTCLNLEHFRARCRLRER